MQERKVLSLGSSLAITLPRPWVISNKIQKGDKITYEINPDQSLIVTTGNKKIQDNKLTVHINENNDAGNIQRSIIAGFLNGYNTIHLITKKYFTQDQQRIIRTTSNRLYMMILRSDSNHIILQNLLDEKNTSIINSLERMHIITTAMSNDLLLCMQEPNKKNLESIIALEDDIDQMKLLLSRLIRISVINPFIAVNQALDPLDCLDYQIMVNRIERVVDHFTNITINLLSMEEEENRIPEKLLPVFLSTMDKSFNSFNTAVKSFINKDIKVTDEIIDGEKEIIKMFETITPFSDFITENEEKVIVHLIHIRESIRKISHYSADIAEITIDQTYKK